jgi:hypothetical protein
VLRRSVPAESIEAADSPTARHRCGCQLAPLLAEQ